MEKPKGWGSRHGIVLLIFCYMVLNQGMKVNLSVAIVAMVNQDNNKTEKMGQECPFPSSEETEFSRQINSSLALNEDLFDWGAKEQGYVLGAFYYGFIISLIPGGYLVERCSVKYVMLVSLLSAVVCTFLSPLIATFGVPAFVTLKVIQGLLVGPIYPGTMTLISNWIPPCERSSSTTFIWAGQELGTAATFALCGFLAEALGWQWDFYFFAILGLIFSLFWIAFVSSNPSEHARISQEEKDWIESSIGSDKSRSKLPVAPYKAIATSVPFWALAVTFVSSGWGFYMLLTEIPTYLNNIQHIPLTTNGLVSSLPFVLSWFFSLIAAGLSDCLISSKKLSTSATRKLMTSIGFLGPAFGLVSLTLIGCNPTLAVVLLCIAVMLEGTGYPGYHVNPLELSPNYAGTLKGATATFANMCGFLTPTLAGYLTEGQQTIQTWNLVFYITAGVYVLGTLVFVMLGKTSVQPWNSYWENHASSN